MSKNLRVKTSKFVDETYRVSFKFNGSRYYGYKGDTLASALLANDVHLIGRSFKYHNATGSNGRYEADLFRVFCFQSNDASTTDVAFCSVMLAGDLA